MAAVAAMLVVVAVDIVGLVDSGEHLDHQTINSAAKIAEQLAAVADFAQVDSLDFLVAMNLVFELKIELELGLEHEPIVVDAAVVFVLVATQEPC